MCSFLLVHPRPLASDHTMPPFFLFVVDTYIIEEELVFLKMSLIEVISFMLENAFHHWKTVDLHGGHGHSRPHIPTVEPWDTKIREHKNGME